MSLSRNQLENICLLRHGDERNICRYLGNDELDESVWVCRKLHQSSKSRIDSEAESAKLRGDRGVPLGDNCPGYPLLRNVTQGYDVD